MLTKTTRRIKWNNILLGILINVMACNISFAISQREESQIRNALQGISTTILSVINKAENLYSNRGAGSITSPQVLLNNASGNYFQSIDIVPNFNVRLKFQGADISSSSNLPGVPQGSQIRTPVPAQLQNKRILMVAVYGKGDSQISYWQCITDADYGNKDFMADVAYVTLSSKTLSIIANYSSGSAAANYIGSCYYVSPSEFDTLWNNIN